LIAFWTLGRTVGAALLIRPELGVGIRPSNGDTPSDFVTALLVAAYSLSIVGGGTYSAGRGAYSKFKALLTRRRALDRWYDFEWKATERGLREWCEEIRSNWLTQLRRSKMAARSTERGRVRFAGEA
jgi:hypothetical protein